MMQRAGNLLRIPLRTLLLGLCLAGALGRAKAQSPRPAARAMYHNPILFADYSDPDVIRDGANYYLIASTFHFVPGIPILQSTDLVHWTIIGHVVNRLDMDPRYSMIGGDRYGKGVWAPSIRKHDGRFYVYFPTPSEGIFMSTAEKITGPWSEPQAVIAGARSRGPLSFLGRRWKRLLDSLGDRRWPSDPASHVARWQTRAR